MLGRKTLTHDEIAAESYVLLTTFRKVGVAVSTPVWIVDGGDGRLFVTTDGASGKIKRIRNNSRVELTPCDMRGTTKADAVTTPATAEVLTDSASRAAIEIALKKKYRLSYAVIRAAGKLRGAEKTSVVVSITVTPAS